MRRLFAVYGACIAVCSWMHAGEFHVASQVAVHRGMSADGSCVILRTIPGAAEKSYHWRPGVERVQIPDLPGGATRVRALAISADGSTVVGWSSSGNGDSEAFRWRDDGTMEGLGDLATSRFESDATGCSSNGDIVYGQGLVNEGGNPSPQAAVWDAKGNITGMGFIPGGYQSSAPRDCSTDGSVIMGSGFGEESVETFRWTHSTGMVPFGRLPDESGTPAFGNTPIGLSDDGNLIAGLAYAGSIWTATEPSFIWMKEGDDPHVVILRIPDDLELRYSPEFNGLVSLISDDMNTLVIRYGDKNQGSFLRWNRFTGIQYLENPEKGATLIDLSRDGRVIVGYITGNDNQAYAAIWGPDGKARRLKEFLEANATDTGDHFLSAAVSVSDSGRKVAGSVLVDLGATPMSYHASFEGLWVFDDRLDDAWHESDWYGFTATLAGELLWHTEHGFQWVSGESEQSVTLYDVALDSWFWTSSTLYPCLYKYGYREGWVTYYECGTPGERQFYIIADQELVPESQLVTP